MGNRIIRITEPIFTFIYIAEALIKIIAMGFMFGGSNCYLKEPWNWLDFVVVIFGILDLLPGFKSISGLRTFRLFRPLRSLSTLPSMRILLNTLLNSVYQLFNISILIIFFYAIFSILGISLWSGILHSRCRLTAEP